MVVPLYDDNPFTQPVKPVVTWCLIAANLGMYFFEAGASQAGLDRIIDTFGLRPAAFAGYGGPGGWLAASGILISYQFFHADIGHLLDNMNLLWEFGDDMERVLGRLHYRVSYLNCGAMWGLSLFAYDVRLDN